MQLRRSYPAIPDFVQKLSVARVENVQRARRKVRSGDHGDPFAIGTEHHSERPVVHFEMTSRRSQPLPGGNQVGSIALRTKPGIDNCCRYGKNGNQNSCRQNHPRGSAHASESIKLGGAGVKPDRNT